MKAVPRITFRLCRSRCVSLIHMFASTPTSSLVETADIASSLRQNPVLQSQSSVHPVSKSASSKSHQGNSFQRQINTIDLSHLCSFYAYLSFCWFNAMLLVEKDSEVFHFYTFLPLQLEVVFSKKQTLNLRYISRSADRRPACEYSHKLSR